MIFILKAKTESSGQPHRKKYGFRFSRTPVIPRISDSNILARTLYVF